MRKLDLVEFVSVDGVMQALAGPDGDFPYPGWGLDYPVESEEDPDSAHLRRHQCLPVRAEHLRGDGGLLAAPA